MNKNKKFATLAVIVLLASTVNNISLAQCNNDMAVTKPSEIEKDTVSGLVEKNGATASSKEPNLLLNPSNQLGLTFATNSINKSNLLLQQHKIIDARNTLEPVFDWLSSSTEYHANLYKVLKDIPTAKAQADVERDLALKYAVLRDKASYQLALIYIDEKKPQKAVANLVSVVRSQPRTTLGFNSYNVLQQIGFTYKLQLENAQPQASEDQSNAQLQDDSIK